MGRLVDLTGRRQGRLKVLARAGKNKHGQSLWRVLCDCGSEKVLPQGVISSGRTSSCGCLRHGHARRGAISAEYAVWHSMINRCTKPRHKSWPRYGGRGVRVCNRWSNFERFLADMGRRPSPAHQLDRYPDNDGNYEPDNCRWALPVENARNRSTNVKIAALGQVRCVTEWAELTGITPQAIRRRIARGWDAARAATTPRATQAQGSNAGSKHGLAKLIESDVLRIREECAGEATQRSVAQKYGVCAQSVSDIVRRRRWRHVG
jgi:hypothetical protein